MNKTPVYAELEKDLNMLSIVPPKPISLGLIFLEQIRKSSQNFDPTSPLDRYLTDDGAIIDPKAENAEDVSKAIINEIIESITHSNVPEECMQIVSLLEEQMYANKFLENTMIALVISFNKTMSEVAKSGKFGLDVVVSFFQEVEIFLGLFIRNDVANVLPQSWHDFRQLAENQLELLKRYIEAQTYTHKHDLLWSLNDDTSYQRDFLKRCIRESVGFKEVMSEVGPALDSMLSLQEVFIMKLITRLQASKTAQHTPGIIAAEC